MADSEISTTLPFVTHRDLLMGTVAAAPYVPRATEAEPFSRGVGGACSFDPALLLWRQWKEANRTAAALCRAQQMLETQLLKTVGFPIAATDVETNDREGEGVGGEVEFPRRHQGPAEASLECVQGDPASAARQAKWDREDRRLGYSAALEAEMAVAEKEQELLDALMAAPATTLAGVAGKLEAIMCEGQPSEDSGEFPWPHIRSVLADLDRLGETRISHYREQPLVAVGL